MGGRTLWQARENPRERELVEHAENHASCDVRRNAAAQLTFVLRSRDDAAEHAQEVRELGVLVLLHELAALAQLDREDLGGGWLVVNELQVRLDERAQLLARRLVLGDGCSKRLVDLLH